MTSKEWKEVIIQECKDAGTYKPFFGSVIETLAGILEMRDDAQAKFDSTGKNTVVRHTNKGGATNIVKNPALVVVMECNSQALSYWRELGLTCKAYKELTGEKAGEKKQVSLESVLSRMGI